MNSSFLKDDVNKYDKYKDIDSYVYTPTSLQENCLDVLTDRLCACFKLIYDSMCKLSNTEVCNLKFVEECSYFKKTYCKTVPPRFHQTIMNRVLEKSRAFVKLSQKSEESIRSDIFCKILITSFLTKHTTNLDLTDIGLDPELCFNNEILSSLEVFNIYIKYLKVGDTTFHSENSVKIVSTTCCKLESLHIKESDTFWTGKFECFSLLWNYRNPSRGFFDHEPHMCSFLKVLHLPSANFLHYVCNYRGIIKLGVDLFRFFPHLEDLEGIPMFEVVMKFADIYKKTKDNKRPTFKLIHFYHYLGRKEYRNLSWKSSVINFKFRNAIKMFPSIKRLTLYASGCEGRNDESGYIVFDTFENLRGVTLKSNVDYFEFNHNSIMDEQYYSSLNKCTSLRIEHVDDSNLKRTIMLIDKYCVCLEFLHLSVNYLLCIEDLQVKVNIPSLQALSISYLNSGTSSLDIDEIVSVFPYVSNISLESIESNYKITFVHEDNNWITKV